MADVTGTINGTDSIIEYSTDGTNYSEACGETTHSGTFTTQLIDITNKCSEEKTTYMEGSGLQNADVTLSVLMSDDGVIDAIIDSWSNKTYLYIRRTYGSWTIETKHMVQEFSPTAEMNSPIPIPVTLPSSGDWTITKS